jgi:hypothetical protein
MRANGMPIKITANTNDDIIVAFERRMFRTSSCVRTDVLFQDSFRSGLILKTMPWHLRIEVLWLGFLL